MQNKGSNNKKKNIYIYITHLKYVLTDQLESG